MLYYWNRTCRSADLSCSPRWPGKGLRIHLLESLNFAGGSCDGPQRCSRFLHAWLRDGQPLWVHGICSGRSIIGKPSVSVWWCYWLNKHDPNYSLCETSEKVRQKMPTQISSSDKSSLALASCLWLRGPWGHCPDSFMNTNFWLYWRAMFAFKVVLCCG